jgi:hypothetical protein
MKIKSPKDFWSGLMFMGFGLFAAIWAVTHYQMGTAVRMGPAYFPAVLGGLLFVLGLIIFLGSFVMDGPKVPPIYFRPLFFISLGCLLYGYLMKPLGLVGATAALVFVGAFGGHEFRWWEVAILYVLLIVFSWLVFIRGLGLPFPIWPAQFS